MQSIRRGRRCLHGHSLNVFLKTSALLVSILERAECEGGSLHLILPESEPQVPLDLPGRTAGLRWVRGAGARGLGSRKAPPCNQEVGGLSGAWRSAGRSASLAGSPWSPPISSRSVWELGAAGAFSVL